MIDILSTFFSCMIKLSEIEPLKLISGKLKIGKNQDNRFSDITEYGVI